MKSYCLAALLLTVPALAQGDRVFTVDGKSIDDVAVTSWDVRQLKYKKGGREQTLSGDQVVRVELEDFRDVFRLGLSDSDLMLTKTREQLAEKNNLMAQIGFVRASSMFFDEGRPQEASAALDELAKSIDDAGTLPEIYRQKFEYYMGLDQRGASSAGTVAKKYITEAQGNAWPQGYVVEAEFFQALAERAAGGDPKAFQANLEGIVQRAAAVPMVQNRANVQLANSLLQTNDNAKARAIYERIAKQDGVDDASLGGAYLGLGLLTTAEATDQEQHKRALLWFLRVHLETEKAWPHIKAEALYNAVQAAGKWRGPRYQYIQARCRGALKAEFPDSNWTERALQGR